MPSEKSMHIAILGCGFIGNAVLEGLVASDTNSGPSGWKYTACVRSEASKSRVQSILDKYEGHSAEVVRGEDQVAELAKKADVLLLGCQPQDLKALIDTPGFASNVKGKIVVSLVAGEPVEKIAKALVSAGAAEGDDELCVARAIPTMGSKIGRSVSLLSNFPPSQAEKLKAVEHIFSRIGDIERVPEHLMSSATGLGAVCHALIIEAVEALTDASVASGVPRDMAQSISAKSLQSASQLLAQCMTPESMKDAMSTPKGITMNSLVRLGGARLNIADTTSFAIKYANGMSD